MEQKYLFFSKVWMSKFKRLNKNLPDFLTLNSYVCFMVYIKERVNSSVNFHNSQFSEVFQGGILSASVFLHINAKKKSSFMEISRELVK